MWQWLPYGGGAVLAVSRWFFSQMADSVLSTEAAAASYKDGGSGTAHLKDSKGGSGSLDSGGKLERI